MPEAGTMSTLGQKAVVRRRSAKCLLWPEADIGPNGWNLRESADRRQAEMLILQNTFRASLASPAAVAW
jgi:uncharacterized protein YbdZ (MbtH family)